MRRPINMTVKPREDKAIQDYLEESGHHLAPLVRVLLIKHIIECKGSIECMVRKEDVEILKTIKGEKQ